MDKARRSKLMDPLQARRVAQIEIISLEQAVSDLTHARNGLSRARLAMRDCDLGKGSEAGINAIEMQRRALSQQIKRCQIRIVTIRRGLRIDART